LESTLLETLLATPVLHLMATALSAASKPHPSEITEMSTIIGFSGGSASKPAAVQPWRVTLLKLVQRWISQFREHRQNRRDLLILRELDDHALADIGLRRGDLAYIARYGKAPPDIAAADGR